MTTATAQQPYTIVVGLEVHVELKTESKVFCGCPTTFGAEPNAQVCPVCLGLPGARPVLNRRAVEQAMRAALALNCKIRDRQAFDRKHYHYPDLAKGFQVSQFDLPLGYEGWIEVPDGNDPSRLKRIRIRRAHLEEDTGKSIHDQLPGSSLVDYNRAGVPLLEIVTEPDLNTPEEVRDFINKLRLLMLYAGVSDVRMEEGSLRVDCNVSIKPHDPRYQTDDVKITEIKNLNSVRSAMRAVAYEAQRQWRVLEQGGRLETATRHWNEQQQITIASRSKEEANDYRIMRDPDLLPLVIDPDWLAQVEASMPEMPDARQRRYVEDYALSDYDASLLVAEPALADYFEATLAHGAAPKAAANWLMGDVAAYLNAENIAITDLKVTPAQLADLIKQVDQGVISLLAAKDVFAEMCASGADPRQIIEAKGLSQISDEAALAAIIDQVIADNPGPVADVQAGKHKAIGFLVGQVMKQSKGRANPQLVNELLRQRLTANEA